jgi:hypothetical protein
MPYAVGIGCVKLHHLAGGGVRPQQVIWHLAECSTDPQTPLAYVRSSA